MLREIGPVRQDMHGVRRRWFQDEDIDLFVWQSADGRLTALQLCYDRRRHERALTWHERTGFAHHQVDSGEHSPKRDMSPVLRASADAPYFEIYHRFVGCAATLDPSLRSFVLARLQAYREALYGRPRRPRRRAKGVATNT